MLFSMTSFPYRPVGNNILIHIILYFDSWRRFRYYHCVTATLRKCPVLIHETRLIDLFIRRRSVTRELM